MPLQKTKAEFIQPMLLLGTERLPEKTDWLNEVNLAKLLLPEIPHFAHESITSQNLIIQVQLKD